MLTDGNVSPIDETAQQASLHLQKNGEHLDIPKYEMTQRHRVRRHTVWKINYFSSTFT